MAGFLQVNCESGIDVVYLYETNWGVLTVIMPSDGSSYTIIEGTMASDRLGIVPNTSGVVKVEAEWITGDKIFAIAVGFGKNRKMGISLMIGNENRLNMKANKMGYLGKLTGIQLARLT